MGSPAYEVAKYLAASMVGTFAGSASWSINVSREPVKPDNAVTVYDTGGLDPDTDQYDLRPSFQVRVRSFSYPDAYAKHEQIRDLLIDPVSLVMEGTPYVGVWMSTDIQAIGRDEQDRHLVVANYIARKERG